MTGEDITQVIREITILKLNELVKAYEKEFGVNATAPVTVVGAAAGGAAVAKEETEFDVVLASTGSRKTEVVKVVRGSARLRLKEAEEIVDGVPKTLKEGVSGEEAEGIKARLAEVGVEVKVK